jgi:hypothetical protein
MGPNNAWTIMLWFQPDIDAADDYYFVLHGTGANDNRILLYSQGSTTARIDLYSSTGTLIKRYTSTSATPHDQIWTQFVFTWDGSTDTLLWYWDAEDANPTKNTDNSGNQDNNLYQLSVGATTVLSANGKFLNMYSMAMWNSVLTADEVTAIYNLGDGKDVDLANDSGDYVSSSDLAHWWRFGEDSSDIGKDYVTESSDFDLMEDASGIDATNVVAGFPDPDDRLKRSLSMDGFAERMRSLNQNDVGVNNTFTVAVWCKPNTALADYIFDMNDGANANRMVWYTNGTATTWRCDLYDSTGTLKKNYNKDTLSNTWMLLSATWDGTNLKMYKNGVDVNPTKTTDNACIQTDAVDTLVVGNSYNTNQGMPGYIHQCMIWSSALTAAELVAVYNSGNGINFDPTSDSGDYASSADLIRWFRFGYLAEDIGKDYAGAAVAAIDLMDNAQNIAKVDIETEAPFV